jgi:hypothetical protein
MAHSSLLILNDLGTHVISWALPAHTIQRYHREEVSDLIDIRAFYTTVRPMRLPRRLGAVRSTAAVAHLLSRPAENAKIADWLAERNGFELSVPSA